MPLVVNIRYEKRLQPQFSATGPVKSTASSLHSSIQQDSAGFSNGVRKVVEEVVEHITCSNTKTHFGFRIAPIVLPRDEQKARIS